MAVSGAADDPFLVALGGGVHAYLQPDGGWGLNNAGILAGPGGITLIDTAMTNARTQRLRDAAAAVGEARPVRTVVNTHHHPDHTFGNSLFPAATIVAHEHCRTAAARVGAGPSHDPAIGTGPVEVRLPDVTFASRMQLFHGDEPVELLHLGSAHTLEDIVVWFPARKLLFAGDLIFAGATPLVMDGTIARYFATIDALRSLRAETIVCGHGAITDASCLDPLEAYLRFVQTVARDGYRSGKTPLELARATDLGEFAALAHPERIVANLHRAFSELRGESDGAPIAPVPQLFREMGEYQGHPLEWHLSLPCAG
ncbi:MAG: MBL fold metallo-hydrolase [Candidatus Velthaea sp.]